MAACAPDEQTACAALNGFQLLVGLVLGALAARVIRRRHLTVSRNGTVIEGRAAVATGTFVLVLLGVCSLAAVYGILENLWGFSLPRRVEVVLGGIGMAIIVGGTWLGAIAAVLWARSVRRRRRETRHN